MLCLYLQAPFGVFRTFTAGSFRPTAAFVTHSAAYGLLLNVAGVEMREDADGEMTVIRSGLPTFRMALGARVLPLQHSVYQQLHNYPIGNTGEAHAAHTKGSKYNIAPVRRSFLSHIQAYICVDGNDVIERLVIQGLEGAGPSRYGLPFLGDNNFLLDRLEPIRERQPAHWYVLVNSEECTDMPKNLTRLTIAIDRMDMSRTRSALFIPTEKAQVEIPDRAWIKVGY